MPYLFPDAIEQIVTHTHHTVGIVPNDTRYASSWGVVVRKPGGNFVYAPPVISKELAFKMYRAIVAGIRKAEDAGKPVIL